MKYNSKILYFLLFLSVENITLLEKNFKNNKNNNKNNSSDGNDDENDENNMNDDNDNSSSGRPRIESSESEFTGIHAKTRR